MRRWTDSEVSILRACINAGRKIDVIADLLKRPAKIVYHKAWRLRLVSREERDVVRVRRGKVMSRTVRVRQADYRKRTCPPIRPRIRTDLMTFKVGDRVGIECAPQDRGEVCTASGGMLPHYATVSFVSGKDVYLNGIPRAFRLRKNGLHVMTGFDMHRGPRLVPQC